MTRKILITLGLFLLFALTANNVSNFTAIAASRQPAKDITIRGKLQKTVERGGWLVVVEKQKYLILNSQNFKNEKWFAEGNEVEVTGEIKSGVMTTYMEGTPFEAHSMRPFRTKRVRHKRHRLVALGAHASSVPAFCRKYLGTHASSVAAFRIEC